MVSVCALIDDSADEHDSLTLSLRVMAQPLEFKVSAHEDAT